MRRSIFWLASAVALASSSALQSQTPALDSLITQMMTDANVMGLAAAVIVDKKVVWMKGFGYADWQRTRPFMPSTVMNVASIAKPFVGVAMMRAVAAGKLSLDSDVNQYLPFRVVNPYRPAERITLRHLATHSSSITDRWEVYRQTYRFGGDPTEPLGELREYSNIGAALAGYIVERAVGAPVNVYTKRNIFTPLGMTQSGWFMREVDMKNHSTLFVSQNGQTVPILHYGGTTYPDGGLRTSVEDLSKFFIAMLNDGAFGGVRILDAPSAAEMQRFQFTDGNRPTNFPAEDGNSGLFWRTKFNGLRRGHGGNDPGVEVEMLTDESRRVDVIYFSNTSLSGTDRKATGDIFNALWKYGETQRENP